MQEARADAAASQYNQADILYSRRKLDFDDGASVAIGERGTVRGPCDDGIGLEVQFDGGVVTNVLSSEVSRTLELIGGYQIGDTLYSRQRLECGGQGERVVAIGERGTALGLSDDGDGLEVQFDGGVITDVPLSEVSRTLELVGGYKIGDTLYSRQRMQCGEQGKRVVAIGERGMALGPSDDGNGLEVKFEGGILVDVELQDVVCTNELPGGYKLGETVCSVDEMETEGGERRKSLLAPPWQASWAMKTVTPAAKPGPALSIRPVETPRSPCVLYLQMACCVAATARNRVH